MLGIASVLSGRMLRRAALGLVSATIACTACAPVRPDRVEAAKQAPPALAPCMLEGVSEQARCGAIRVPEDPSYPQGRQLEIHFAILPAKGGDPMPDPIVPLLGGPGEDAISDASVFADRFAALRDRRDLLLVDQRGTGRSAPLYCDLHAGADAATSLRHLFPAAGARHCLDASSVHADLRQYTYAHVAHDLEQVRRALGYGPLNLSGGSYGTRAALVYLRAYPRSVRTAYLGSVVPLDVATPLTMARSADAVRERVFRACEGDAACSAAFPRLRHEFAAIDARLSAGEVRVELPAHAGTATLTRGRVAEWFRARTYRPADAAELPWLVHQAYTGNWSPIVEGILEGARNSASALDFGLFLAVTCREDVAFIDEPAIARETRGTFLGDYRVRQQQAACAGWPRDPLPEDYRAQVRTGIPTMFVSGDSDAASPLWFTARVAPGFSDRVEIVARHQGHTEWSPCIADRYERFVRSGATRGIDTTPCADRTRPPFRLH